MLINTFPSTSHLMHSQIKDFDRYLDTKKPHLTQGFFVDILSDWSLCTAFVYNHFIQE